MNIIHGNPHITPQSTSQELDFLQDEIESRMDHDFYFTPSKTHQLARDQWIFNFREKFLTTSYATASRILTQKLEDEKEQEVQEFLYKQFDWEL